MPATVVAPLTVTAPQWGWGIQYQGNTSAFETWNGPYNPDIIDPSPSDYAAQWADNNVDIDPNLNTSDPNVAKWISTIKTLGADLVYSANAWIDQQPPPTTFTLVDLPGFDDWEHGEVADRLNYITFNITSNHVPGGAQAVWSPPHPVSADFTPVRIDINPTQLNTYLTAFSDAQEGRNYVVLHEVGHSLAESLYFNTAYGFPNPGNEKLWEAYANSAGAELAKFLGVAYPSDDELINLNGTLPFGKISGSSGDDLLTDGAGADLLDGGAGIDTVSYASSAGSVLANIGASQSYSSGRDAYYSIENITGSTYGDTLVGSTSANTLTGGAGNDSITGDAGNDVISGGDGNDVLHGNAGSDTIMGNAGNDTILGGQDGDAVRGGQGDDLVFGDIAADLIFGDAGNDTLTGGASGDVFYTHAQAGVDRVMDFSLGDGDRVAIESGSYSSIYHSGADTVVAFNTGAQLVVANVQLSLSGSGWLI